MKCGDIQSDAAEAEFTYVNVDGFDFPTLKDEWRELLSIDRSILARAEEEAAKRKKNEENESEE